jgi:hypothetical protein
MCINTAGLSILSFYIFRGMRFRRNYIEHCKAGTTMAMQGRAWMTAYMFNTWISYFIESVTQLGRYSPTRKHLLILDGYNSHFTLEVVKEARQLCLPVTSRSHNQPVLWHKRNGWKIPTNPNGRRPPLQHNNNNTYRTSQ